MIKGEDFAEFWIEEGILYFTYKLNAIIDLEAARAVLKSRLRFQDGESYPILCDLRLLKTVTKPARDYLAIQGSVNAVAVAVVIEESYSGTLTRAFINISNPSIPTREFTTIPDALKFLEKYKK